MKDQANKPLSGADIVVKTLEDKKVKWVFGIPGAKIDRVFDRLVDSRIQTIVCRHEQNAAFIAGGIGRMTGEAGIALVTSGPGVSNLVTGLATANTEGDPIVALGGSVAVSERLKQVHQSMDAVSLCRPVTKFSAEVDSPESTSEVLANAFRAAEMGRPGAAFVSLPKDIMDADAKCEVLHSARAPIGPANEEAIKAAAKLISTKKRVVVLLGLLASKQENAEAVRAFLERGNFPVVGTFQSAGSIPTKLFSNFGGRVGLLANQPGDLLLENADLVITVGYDAVEYDPSQWNKDKHREIIHVDVLPADIDNSYNPTIELIGDIGSTLEILKEQISPSTHDEQTKRLLETIAADRKQMEQSAQAMNGVPIHPLRLISELQKILSSDMTICSDMGSFHIWLARYLFSFRARQVLISNGQQTLGVALPWAIAATLVRPSEKVLSISGDGGFLFSSMELETAVRLNSHLVHMIWINGTYDMVAVQEEKKYGKPSGTGFGPVDPVKYAEAFGARGFMIKTPDQIAPVLKQSFDASGPVIIGVHVDYSDNAVLFENVKELTVQ